MSLFQRNIERNQFSHKTFIRLVPPMIWIPHQLVGIPLTYNVTLECFVEAFPTSLNYWARENSEMIHDSNKYKYLLHSGFGCFFRIKIFQFVYRTETIAGTAMHKAIMKLSINDVQRSDYGTYKCVAKNPRGETDGTIRLYCK